MAISYKKLLEATYRQGYEEEGSNAKRTGIMTCNPLLKMGRNGHVTYRDSLKDMTLRWIAVSKISWRLYQINNNALFLASGG